MSIFKQKAVAVPKSAVKYNKLQLACIQKQLSYMTGLITDTAVATERQSTAAITSLHAGLVEEI